MKDAQPLELDGGLGSPEPVGVASKGKPLGLRIMTPTNTKPHASNPKPLNPKPLNPKL